MANDIEILLLQPHTSHLLQPLDVAIFGPLSMALTRRLEPLNRQMRRRLQKNEWLEQYALARADAITPNNIASAWRGAGLFPFQPQKVYRHLPADRETPPVEPQIPTTVMQSYDQLLLTSSPTGNNYTQRDQATIETMIENISGLPDDQRCFIKRINDRTNRYKSRVTVAERELSERRQMDEKAKRQKSGKRAVIEDSIAICTVEIRDGVVAAGKLSREKKKRKCDKTGKSKARASEKVSNNEELAGDSSESDVSDCIIVRRA